jgi:thiol-disulfide isomerase/thioredoxin
MHKLIPFIILFWSFTMQLQAKKLKAGPYRAVLILDEVAAKELPFNFELHFENKKPIITIRNGEEKIRVDEIQVSKDSVFIRMPVFDTEFRCKVKGNMWEGLWINHYRKTNATIPFKAYFNQSHRFEVTGVQTSASVEGKWEVNFKGTGGPGTKAIGIFHHIEQSAFVSGTFLTETGDYRYLDGVMNENRLQLSCFDGSHAFLFEATLNNKDTLDGVFFSGSHWKERWVGFKNDSAKLRDPEEITFAEKKDSVLYFRYKDPDGKWISSSDSFLKNKVMVVQLMGSWCPNCMDESRYLKQVYEKYKAAGLEIVALAFEKTNDAEKSKAQVQRMKSRLQIPYTVLLTEKTGKDKASEAFPFLNEVSAFPTTLFLDRSHQIVKIHTGFNGPATGAAYDEFVKQTELLIERLLSAP